MTEISDMLTSLKRIETSLANIETMLDACLQKPEIEWQPLGLNQRIRSQLQRLRRQNREKTNGDR